MIIYIFFYPRYTVNWDTFKGISEDTQLHYLDILGRDVNIALQNTIDLISRKFRTDFVYPELIQHHHLCLKKSEEFCGRKQTLSALKNYLLSKNCRPFLLHGDSGSGKTSLMSKASAMVRMKHFDPHCPLRSHSHKSHSSIIDNNYPLTKVT